MVKESTAQVCSGRHPDPVGHAWRFLCKMPETAVKTLQTYYSLRLKVTKLMADNGVEILAGSDVGRVKLVPGFSLHYEFHELAAAGLSPL